MAKQTKKRLARLAYQEELLKHFVGDFYQEKEVGDSIYVKMYYKPQDRWIVAKYSKQSFRKYKSIQKQLHD